jgi:hypothetical protein
MEGKMMEQELTDRLCMLKGFVSGSLFAISILSGYGLAPQLIIFIIAVLIFMENIFYLGREAHVFTTVLFNLFGVVVSLLLWLYSLTLPYTVFIITLLVLVYGYMIFLKSRS